MRVSELGGGKWLFDGPLGGGGGANAQRPTPVSAQGIEHTYILYTYTDIHPHQNGII